ncbi:MAG: cytochrome c maturation protein CcmE [Pseudomonadota bacterium]
MTPVRRRRLYMVLGIIGGVAVAAAFGLQAFNNSIGYRSPTEVAAGAMSVGKHFQIGGMVKEGSVRRTSGTLETHFVITDFQSDVPAVYTKVLPDLFKEKSGVWANGKMNAQGVFIADEVLAKHDENYMPPAVGKTLQKGQSRLDSPPQAAPPQVN